MAERLAFMFSALHRRYTQQQFDCTAVRCALLDDGTHREYTEAMAVDAIDVQPATEHFGDLVFLGYGTICREHSRYDECQIHGWHFCPSWGEMICLP